mgnify:CR=1 FL=1
MIVIQTKHGAFYSGTFPPRELQEFSKELLELADGTVLTVSPPVTENTVEVGTRITIKCINGVFVYDVVRDDFQYDSVTARLVKSIDGWCHRHLKAHGYPGEWQA